MDHQYNLSHGHDIAKYVSPHLLADQSCDTCLILPLAQEQFTQERIQGLLLTPQSIATTAVLLLERAEEPFRD